MSRKIDVYTIEELKKQFPDAYDKAYEEFKKDISNDPYLPWQEEIMGSMKAIIKHSGFTLRDWEIGAYCYSSVKIEYLDTYIPIIDEDGFETEEEDRVDVGELCGKDAKKYIFDALDIKSAKKVFFEYDGKKHHRWDAIQKNGKDWSCELTGVCFDHDFLHHILDELESGETIADAYRGLADVARKLFEDEYESQLTEEYFLEEASNNNYEYTEEGDRI